jgi:hypothetical protein
MAKALPATRRPRQVARRPRARRGEAARIEGVGRRAQQVGRFEEEGPLLGNREREARIARELRHVQRHLREIGLEGAVDHQLGAGAPFDVQAGVDGMVVAARAVVLACMRAAQREAGPQRQEGMLLGQLHALQRLHRGDEARRLARHRHRGDEVEALARQPARDHDAPAVLLALGKAQAGQRQAQHRGPALRVRGDGGVPVEIGREILAVVGRGVQAVGAAAGGIDAEELRRAPAADGIEVDDHEILRAVDLVVAHQRAAHAPGLGLQRGDADIDGTRVVQHLHARGLRRRRAELRVAFDEAVVDRRARPGRVVEPAVEPDALAGRQRHRAHRLGLLGPGTGGDDQQGGTPQRGQGMAQRHGARC